MHRSEKFKASPGKCLTKGTTICDFCGWHQNREEKRGEIEYIQFFLQSLTDNSSFLYGDEHVSNRERGKNCSEPESTFTWKSE